MSHQYKHRCARRSVPPPCVIPAASLAPPAIGEQPFGAGSGGDHPDMQAYNARADHSDGHYSILGQEVEILAQAGHPFISLEAVNDEGKSDGLAFIQIHGDKGMRVTTGTTTETRDMQLDGVDIVTEKNQEIMLQRGLNSDNIQRINMTSGMVLIDANLGELRLTSMKSILLQVAGGTSYIEITPEGIVVQGPLIGLN